MNTDQIIKKYSKSLSEVDKLVIKMGCSCTPCSQAFKLIMLRLKIKEGKNGVSL